MSTIELPRAVTRASVEAAHRFANECQRSQRLGVAEAGMRAARAKDRRLLLVLDKAANILDHEADHQYGRTRRDPRATRADKAPPTEASLWREAYRLADVGTPLENFSWIYGAAAWLAGLVS